jgi:hypothetical protein
MRMSNRRTTSEQVKKWCVAASVNDWMTGNRAGAGPEECAISARNFIPILQINSLVFSMFVTRCSLAAIPVLLTCRDSITSSQVEYNFRRPCCTVFCFLSLFFSLAPTRLLAQSLSPDVQPAPLVRLTGVLDAAAYPHTATFPVLKVWVGNNPLLFRVARIEAVISAYPAEERLRQVSPLGLRFLADEQTLAALQSLEMQDRLIVIEGWLRLQPGVLRIRSVKIKDAPSRP